MGARGFGGVGSAEKGTLSGQHFVQKHEYPTRQFLNIFLDGPSVKGLASYGVGLSTDLRDKHFNELVSAPCLISISPTLLHSQSSTFRLCRVDLVALLVTHEPGLSTNLIVRRELLDCCAQYLAYFSCRPHVAQSSEII